MGLLSQAPPVLAASSAPAVGHTLGSQINTVSAGNMGESMPDFVTLNKGFSLYPYHSSFMQNALAATMPINVKQH